MRMTREGFVVSKETKTALNTIGGKLSKVLPEFYGKVTFNLYNGHYTNMNIEQSIKPDNLKKGADSG